MRNARKTRIQWKTNEQSRKCLELIKLETIQTRVRTRIYSDWEAGVQRSTENEINSVFRWTRDSQRQQLVPIFLFLFSKKLNDHKNVETKYDFDRFYIFIGTWRRRRHAYALRFSIWIWIWKPFRRIFWMNAIEPVLLPLLLLACVPPTLLSTSTYFNCFHSIYNVIFCSFTRCICRYWLFCSLFLSHTLASSLEFQFIPN